jgi:AbrB family looped-hinge helix DNA binding protein
MLDVEKTENTNPFLLLPKPIDSQYNQIVLRYLIDKKVWNMETTTISTKFQVVIPRKIRDQFHLKAGQKVMFIPYKNSLRMVIVPPIEEGQGFLKGIDTTLERDEEDRV